MNSEIAGPARHLSDRVPLPSTREDITAGWMTQALSCGYPGVEVISATVGPFLGYKPNKVRVSLTYNASGVAAGLPPSMIVKATFPGREGSGQGLDFATVQEAISYRDVVTELGVPTPKAYFLQIGADNTGAALILEDLSLRGATYCNAFAPLHYGQASSFVDGLARMHAVFWNSDALHAGGRFGPGTPVGTSRALYHRVMREFVGPNPVYAKTMRSHRDLPRAAVLPRAFADQRMLHEAIPRSLEVLQNSPLVIIHGDEHLGNLYLQADGTAGFLDWFARPEHWSIGFAYFLVAAVDMLDRRNWERPLLAYYLQQLLAYGATPMSMERAWFEYRCSLVWPLATWFVNPGEWQPERLNVVNASRATLAAIDHDPFKLLGL